MQAAAPLWFRDAYTSVLRAACSGNDTSSSPAVAETASDDPWDAAAQQLLLFSPQANASTSTAERQQLAGQALSKCAIAPDGSDQGNGTGGGVGQGNGTVYQPRASALSLLLDLPPAFLALVNVSVGGTQLQLQLQEDGAPAAPGVGPPPLPLPTGTPLLVAAELRDSAGRRATGEARLGALHWCVGNRIASTQPDLD